MMKFVPFFWFHFFAVSGELVNKGYSGKSSLLEFGLNFSGCITMLTHNIIIYPRLPNTL